tara:strand:+ start:1419 stop:1661 length:243 start_codon:yes stop_codon:yes gene_type:complete
MVELFTGISILIDSSFIGLLIRDYIANTSVDNSSINEEDAFCEIDVKQVLIYSKKSEVKEIGELKRKLEEFKNRNKFYKM